ncbi:MAG: hypothetical protein ACWGQW_12245, partial [bacterium]
MSSIKRNEVAPVLIWRLLLSTFLVPGLVGLAFSQEQVSQEEPIRVDVNLVTLRFSVRDSQGDFLNSVGRDEFRVIENGASCDISFFQQPRSAVRLRGSMWLAFL